MSHHWAFSNTRTLLFGPRIYNFSEVYFTLSPHIFSNMFCFDDGTVITGVVLKLVSADPHHPYSPKTTEEEPRSILNRTLTMATSSTTSSSASNATFTKAMSQLSQGLKKQALSTLQSIPETFRTPATHLATGRIFKAERMNKEAISSFKMALKLSLAKPFSKEAMEATKNLLVLNVSIDDLESIFNKESNSSRIMNKWLKSLAFCVTHKYEEASQMLMEVENLLQEENTYKVTLTDDDKEVLALLGHCLHLLGKSQQALNTLNKLHSKYPSFPTTMDLLGSLFYAKKDLLSLEKLYHSLSGDKGAERLVVMSYICLLEEHQESKNQLESAEVFAKEALEIHHRRQRQLCLNTESYIETLLLSGRIARLKGDFEVCAKHLTSAKRLNMNRFDVHEALVQCFLDSDNVRKAVQSAEAAMAHLPSSARAHCLYASVLKRHEQGRVKARRVLDKALELDPNHLQSLNLAAGIFRPKEALKLVRKQGNAHGCSELSEKVAELILAVDETETPNDRLCAALDHYWAAFVCSGDGARFNENMGEVEQWVQQELGLN